MRLLIAALGSFFALAMLGTAFAPKLLVEHPLLLVALNPVLRHLVLASNQIDALPFVLVGLLRLLGPDPFHYLLGRWYGDVAVEWIERRSPRSARAARFAERAFARAGLVLLFVSPEGIINVLAGAARVRPAVFLTLNVAGTLCMLMLVRAFGARYDAALGALLAFIQANVIGLTAASVIAVGVGVLLRRRRTVEAARRAKPPAG